VTDFIHNSIIFGVGFVASAINAFAFGGSLVSFPTLIWLGVPPIIANATNTAAVWPGSLGAVWGYRRELRQTAPHMYWLIVPSVAGAIAGAVLLRITPPDVLIGWCRCSFCLHGPVCRPGPRAEDSSTWLLSTMGRSGSPQR
jgi:uncharacterized membrane protein YfcA